MYKNILVINLMYIGDLLFMTPFLHVLRQHFPEAHIALLADKKNALVVKNNPNISELIAIDKKGYHNKLPNYLRLIADMRARHFDLVLNLHANERASAIAAFSGAGRIVGFSARGFGLLFDEVVGERRDIHQADAYLEVLRHIGIDDLTSRGLELWTDEAAEMQAERLFNSHFADTRPPVIIGMNTGGSWPTKRWRADGFTQLTDKLLAAGYGVIFFGGPMDEPAVNDIVSGIRHKDTARLAIVTGRTSLLEMAALVKKCTLLVSGDSGPMHIAVACHVPVLAIFGPSAVARYAPYHQDNAVISSTRSCLGCGQHECQEHGCMKDITPEVVMARIKDKVEACYE